MLPSNKGLLLGVATSSLLLVVMPGQLLYSRALLLGAMKLLVAAGISY